MNRLNIRREAARRRAAALTMHQQGMTYRAIGEAFAISANRARQLVQEGLFDEGYVPPELPAKITRQTRLASLPWSMRTLKLLEQVGFETVGDLIRPDPEQFMIELLSTPNWGGPALREIKHYLDMVVPDPSTDDGGAADVDEHILDPQDRNP